MRFSDGTQRMFIIGLDHAVWNIVQYPNGTQSGWRSLGGWIIHLLYRYLDGNDIGELFGADSPFRLVTGLVRLPDVFGRMHAATKPATLGLLCITLGIVAGLVSTPTDRYPEGMRRLALLGPPVAGLDEALG